MDASNFPGTDLLIKYIYEDITDEELALLYKYMEDSPVLKAKFEEWSDPVKLRNRFRYQFDIDNEAGLRKIKEEYHADQRRETGLKIKINWPYFLHSRRYRYTVAIILVLCGAFAVFYYNVFSKNADTVNMLPNNNHEVDAPIEDTSGGYMDLAGNGIFNLDKIPDEGITTAVADILNQGALFTIRNKEKKLPRAINKLVTADKQIKLQLPDGSRVTLNTYSSIAFELPFDNGERTVSVTGEAYFEVESNPKVPFIVQLNNNATVKAYGTAFTVNCAGKVCYTTLLRGQVTVIKDGQSQMLSVGEQVKISEGEQVFKVEPVDTAKAIAWAKKEFKFKNIGFKQMMFEVGRWYGYDVSFFGEMPQDKCSIKLNEDVPLSDAVEAIEKNYDVTIQTTTNKKLFVMSKKSDGNNSGLRFQAASSMP